MFTGIITHLGEIVSFSPTPSGCRLAIALSGQVSRPAVGASIACSGVCLTAQEIHPMSADRCVFYADVSRETWEKTTVKTWKVGTKLNIERSLKLGDELGGHFVFGHVDGICEVVKREEKGGDWEVWFRLPQALLPLVVLKGSVTLNGTSLTINEISGDCFAVCLVPHTREVTTWQAIQEGDFVNVEVDMLARYVLRQRAFS